MNETVVALVRASCQSQVDLHSTLVSGLKVNREVAALLVTLGQEPPVLPESLDRIIGNAVEQLNAAKAQQAHMETLLGS